MVANDKVYCDMRFLRNVSEETLENSDGTFKTLSITDQGYELLIFLGRKNKKSDYTVRVYKCEPKRVFFRNGKDKFKQYKERPDYDIFFFSSLDDAKHFIQNIFTNHREYEKRPVTT